MTNLTEKWKKGNLENGYYYVNTIGKDDNNIYEDSIDLFISNMPSIWLGDVTRVKAVVPNLWEWENLQDENQKLKTENKWYSEQLNEAVKQYDNLKELLEECRDKLDTYYEPTIKKIDQVLGE